eukprot:CAMPEP_0196718466 /NCGR_PEP_ID=MMETSP1091-20130531/1654_1 /TAXON_ID=302021 /ORGANISM="Rhodomonas sp., Strain CCMP768" /LENGTH=118 /DNA_ID=CAMNT_0042059129 /DNA_START=28 /DNA_END=384 /DNA_ORIENTATION=-
MPPQRASTLSLALVLLVACQCHAFAPATSFTTSLRAPALRTSSSRNGLAKATMSLTPQAMGGFDVQVDTASYQLVQASVMLADIFDDLGTDNIIYGGLAITVISIAVMLIILYQDGVR